MPPVKQTSNHRQHTQRQPTVSLPTTGILSRAIAVSDLPESFLKVLVYGVNRAGKTVWACQTSPKPLLLVDCEPQKDEGGARSVKGMSGVTFLKLGDVASVEQLAGELINHNPFRTVVIDSVTSLERIVLAEVMRMPAVKDLVKPTDIGLGPAGMDIYMKRSDILRRVLRQYLDLPCHTVFTAKQKDHNPNKGDMRSKMVRGHQEESFYGPDVGGATAEWLKDACDIVQMDVTKEVIVKQVKVGDDTIEREEETGRKVRRLRITMHPNYACGCRTTNLNTPEFIDNPTFESYMKMVHGD